MLVAGGLRSKEVFSVYEAPAGHAKSSTLATKSSWPSKKDKNLLRWRNVGIKLIIFRLEILIRFGKPGCSAALGPLTHVIRNVGPLEFGVCSVVRLAAILLNDESGKIELASRLGRLLRSVIYDSLYNFMSLKNRLSTVEVKFEIHRKNYTTLQPI